MYKQYNIGCEIYDNHNVTYETVSDGEGQYFGHTKKDMIIHLDTKTFCKEVANSEDKEFYQYAYNGYFKYMGSAIEWEYIVLLQMLHELGHWKHYQKRPKDFLDGKRKYKRMYKKTKDFKAYADLYNHDYPEVLAQRYSRFCLYRLKRLNII